MKKTILHLLLILTAACLCRAQLTIPSDGSDGAFSPVGDFEIDLSQAVTGVWSDDNTANTGKGIYDPDKWAVVFKFSSFTVPDATTVTFLNHPSRAPIIILVDGDVTIDGTLDLSGGAGTTGVDALIPAEPGPGGFRGGATGPDGLGSGYGIGGTSPGGATPTYRSTYGNPQVLPLIGGSGAGARNFGVIGSGGSGGGAILIAASGTVDINGSILSKGGAGGANAIAGSGGAVRIIADAVTGTGSVDCTNDGRIRIETNLLSTNVATSPETIAVPVQGVPTIFSGLDTPTVTVVSIDGIAAPVDPRSSLVSSADVLIENNSSVDIVLQTTDFSTSGVVQLIVSRKFGTRSVLPASYTSGDFNSATWTVSTTLDDGFTALQARATSP